MEIIEKISDNLMIIGKKLLLTILIIIIGFKLVDFIKNVLKKGKGFKRLEASVQTFLLSFIGITGKVIVLIIAAGTIGIPMTSVITLIGSAGIAIGLALQGGLSNIAGGLMILIFKPFKVGDYIKTQDIEGKVRSITMFYTRIITIDNKQITVPNSMITSSVVIDYTSMKKRMIELKLSVSYNENIDKVRKVIKEEIEKNNLIIQDTEPFIKVLEHGDSAIIFLVRVWVKTEDYWTVYYDLLENIKKAFDKNKIEIPYPQMDVHVKENKSKK